MVLVAILMPAFSFAEDCRGKSSDNWHNYTCEYKTRPPTAVPGFKDTWYSNLSCTDAGTTCHRFEASCAGDQVFKNGTCQSCPSGMTPNAAKTDCNQWAITPPVQWLTTPTVCVGLQETPCKAAANCERDTSVVATCKNKTPPAQEPTPETPKEKTEREKCLEKYCYGWDAKKNNGEGKCVSLGTKLNTDVPFIGRCISLGKLGSNIEVGTGMAPNQNINQTNAFPTLIGALMRILTSAMLVVGFLMILIAGVMITMGGASPGSVKTGKGLIFKVWAALALLGSLGAILKLINPTFFT